LQKNGKWLTTHGQYLIERCEMFIAFVSYMKSERGAYDRAMSLLESTDMILDSLPLGRYYLSPSYMDKLGDTKVFVIPKKNATLNGSQKWKSP